MSEQNKLWYDKHFKGKTIVLTDTEMQSEGYILKEQKEYIAHVVLANKYDTVNNDKNIYYNKVNAIYIIKKIDTENTDKLICKWTDFNDLFGAVGLEGKSLQANIQPVEGIFGSNPRGMLN